ncbi:MAG: PLP-dependent aminotransferase family protein [Spirochaetaceae bacterium]
MSFKYETVYNDLHTAILSGVFLPTEKLPSLRKSSLNYNCGLSVIIQAYNKLESVGLIQSVEKSGYLVCSIKNTTLPTPELDNHTLLPNISKANIMTSEIIDMAMDKTILPFGAAIPDESILETKKLTKYISRRAQNSPEILSGYTPAGGSINLRKEIVKYMFNRGVVINIKDIIITNGCAEALYISLKLTTKPGDTVAIETPTYFSLISMLEDLGLKAVEVPTKADTGLDLNYLKKSLKAHKIKSLIFSSTFQNPLCSVMSQEVLEELYNLSITNNFTLIEDDIYGDCGFNKTNYHPIKAIDKNGSVIYCSSFSKTLSPGLRIGWVIPGLLSDKFREYKQLSCLGGPALLQEALADYFRDGCYDLHLKSFRKKIYAQTYGIKKLTQQYFPAGFKITNPKGGYFLWIEFPKNLDSYKLYSLAYKNKIGIVPGPVFSMSGKYRNCIRLSCATPITPRISSGIKKLGELVQICLD